MNDTTESIFALYVADESRSAEARSSLEREADRIEVATAVGVRDALDRLADDVDCVVSEYDLPDRTGIDLLRAVRRDRPELPFILYVGDGSEEIASRAVSAGVTDYLRKSGDGDRNAILADRVREAVERYRSRRLRRRCETVLRESNDPVYALDSDGRFAFVNGAFTDLTGYSEAELLGERPARLLGGADAEGVTEAFRELTGDDRTNSAIRELALVTAEGETVPCENRVTLLSCGGGSFEVAGTLRDVSGPMTRERRLEALHEATRELVCATTETEVAEITAEAAKNTLGYRNTVVRLVDEEESVLRPVALTERAREELGERPVYPIGEGTAGRAFERQRPLLYEDVGVIDDGYPRGEGAAAMYVPIGERGTISISDTDTGTFDQSDVELARILAAHAAVTLTRVDQQRELERQNERLEEFVKIASHDLRNPLAVLEGSLELAAETGASEAFDRCRRAVERMDALLDDLLTLARAGTVIDEPRAVDVGSLAERCWRDVETGDATLRVEAEGTIRADEPRLRQVFENLVRNAVEHGSAGSRTRPGDAVERGGTAVTVRVGDLDDGFFLEDDGPGIPVEERERVFESGYSTTVDGSGFGLAIVREIADAHGWSVRVTEGPDGGARFEFTGVSEPA